MQSDHYGRRRNPIRGGRRLRGSRIKNPTDAIGRLDDDEKALAFIEGIPAANAST